MNISIKKISRIFLKVLLAILLLVIFLWILIQTTFFQNILVRNVTKRLSKNLQTTVVIKHVDFDLFNKMLLQETLILDRQKDTLLYAGEVKVNITDWFFMKDNISLNYIGLKDAYVNLYRNDSIWNYQFLVDYFSGPAKNKTDTAKNVIRLNLKEVSFQNVKLKQTDKWVGQDYYAAFGKLELKADKLDLENNLVDISSINLVQPVFMQYGYEGLRPKRVKPVSAGEDVARKQPAGFEWNPENWKIKAKKIDIKNGRVAIQRDGGSPSEAGYFDERNILVSNLSGTLKNIVFAGDSLQAAIVISGQERSGFQISRLSTDYKMTPRLMEFANLDIETPTSHLSDYYAMHYESFNRDMGDFIDAVTLTGRFKDSKISSNDIGFFAPETKAWNTTFFLNGLADGRISNLNFSNIAVTANGNNFLEGEGSLRGLPDVDETFIDLRINKLRTNYNELARLIPAIKTISNPQLSAFGNVVFTGSFTGFINDFVTYGNLSTDIGNLKTDLNLKVKEGQKAQYSGSISTENFQLGKFIRNSDIGKIAFNGKINGSGINENDVNVGIDGTIRQISFRNYVYKDIIAHGEIKGKLFTGNASIHDPNIIIDTLTGSINFSKTNPLFIVNGEVKKLDLHELGFTKDTIALTGIFDLNFEGSNIDNFLGYAKLYDAQLSDNGKQLSFDSLSIESSIFNNSKLISLKTNEIELALNGNFKIADLPDAFQLFLYKYYPAYINKPNTAIGKQDFTFLIQTREVSEYLTLFDKKLSGLDNSVIVGNINIAQNTLNLQADIPQFNFNNIAFNNIHISGIGTEDTLKLLTEIDDVVINDSLHSPGTKIKITAANDISDVTINATANKTLSAADLSARIQTQKNGFTLTFNPSTFTINQKQWNIRERGEIILHEKMLMANDLRLTQNGQEINISTTPSDIGNSNDVIIAMRNIVVEDFTPLFLKTPKLAGLFSGNVRINDPFDRMEVLYDTRLDRFYFEGDSVGVINATGNYYGKSGNVDLHMISNNELYNFIADLDYHPKDSLNQLRGSVVFNNSGIHILEEYLSGILSNIYGRANGLLNISGTTDAPKLTGSVVLNETSITVDYTQCKYLLEDNSTINFNPDEIDFGMIKLRDTLNNTATLTGKIYHRFFDNFFFNELHLKTDSKAGATPKFILLNTTARDNDEFYGHVIGQAELTLNGPVTDMRMNITGEPTDSSHIYLPIGETAESGNLQYIEFIRFGREMKADLKVRENTNIKVNMELTANPLARIDVILDEATGDIIHAQGSGKLFISAGTKDPLTIRGRYNIEEGEYTFNFQTFLKTPFVLQKGYIEWQGDPYLANLNIDATYRAENVILNNIPTSTGISNTRGDVDIIFMLRGTLKNPTPNFEFQFPFDNPLKSDPIANEYLKTRYQSDNNQLLNQVASLLLFNMFMNTDQGLLSSNNTTNFVTKSVGQLLSTTLSSSLNNWLQKLLNTKSVNLYTNINTSDFNFQKGGVQRELQNVGNFGLKTTFLNNKILVNVGGNVDYRMAQAISSGNSYFLFTPDVSFEVLLTPDGRFRVIGFNRSDADPGDIAGVTRRNRTGIQLSYRKNFDTFQEFFTRERLKR